jgi:hypothetical protein
MEEEVIDDPHSVSEPGINSMLMVRIGVFFFIVLLEFDILLGLFLNELMITIDVSPQLNIWLTELIPFVVLLVAIPFFTKRMANVLSSNAANPKAYLKNLTLLFILMSIIYVVNQLWLVNQLPDSYVINWFEYIEYYHNSTESSWAPYIFYLGICGITGLFLKKYTNKTASNKK